jgi:tight adherence protein C
MTDASATVNNAIVALPQILLLIAGGIGLMLALFATMAIVISVLNYEESPVRDRLRLFKEKGTFKVGKTSVGAFDDLREAVITFSGPLAHSLYGQNLKYQKQVKGLLMEAGLPDTEAQVTRFLAQRAAMGLVIGSVAFVVTFVLTFGMVTYCAFALLGGFMLGSMVPQYGLRSQAGKRKTEIRYTMPDTLDLMVVCVEAGLSLDATIQRVAEETERMAPEISYEFKRLNKELNAGISRIEAFQSMGQRAGVDELRSLCAMIVQADKLGTSISDTLRIYADDLRVKRRQKAEELASKASIKMTFPLVLFIFPPMFIILMGPIVINAIQSFYPSAGK